MELWLETSVGSEVLSPRIKLEPTFAASMAAMALSVAPHSVTASGISVPADSFLQVLMSDGTSAFWHEPVVFPDMIPQNCIQSCNVVDASLATCDFADGAVTARKISAFGGSAGQVLTSNGTAVVWADPSTDAQTLAGITGTQFMRPTRAREQRATWRSRAWSIRPPEPRAE